MEFLLIQKAHSLLLELVRHSACTTRGLKEEEFKLIADLIHKVIKV